MEYEEDEYSDRDASGEDDTDYIDANLAERTDGVALDPALSFSNPDPHHVGYPDLPLQNEHVEETGSQGQVTNHRCSSVLFPRLTSCILFKGYPDSPPSREEPSSSYGLQYPSHGYPEEAASILNGNAGMYLEGPHTQGNSYVENPITPSHSWSQDVDMITVRAGAQPQHVASTMTHFDHMSTDFPNLGPTSAMPEAGPSSLPAIVVPVKKTPKIRLPSKKTAKTRGAEVRPSPERPGARPRAPRNTHCEMCHRVNVVDDKGNRDIMLSCWSCGKSGE